MSVVASQITNSRLFSQPFIRAQNQENSKLGITGLCAVNSPVTGEFPAQMASNAENLMTSSCEENVSDSYHQIDHVTDV